jgi:hypothetical protein
MRPPNIQDSASEQGQIAQQLCAFVKALAKAIAAELRPNVCGAVENGASPKYMTLREAARAAKIRTSVLLEAVRLPAQHPGHLRSIKRAGSSNRRRFVSSHDLDLWIRSGGMRGAQQASQRNGAGGKARSGGKP